MREGHVRYQNTDVYTWPPFSLIHGSYVDVHIRIQLQLGVTLLLVGVAMLVAATQVHINMVYLSQTPFHEGTMMVYWRTEPAPSALTCIL